MRHSRPILLLVLLVALPLVLLAWLGTYLISDGERRTAATRQAILNERLFSADARLQADLRQMIDALDHRLDLAQTAKSDPSSVLEGIAIVTKVQIHETGAALAEDREMTALEQLLTKPSLLKAAFSAKEPFASMPGPAQAPAGTAGIFLKTHRGYHLLDEAASSETKLSGVMTEHVNEHFQMRYWRLLTPGALCVALLDDKTLLSQLAARLADKQSSSLPGRMSIGWPGHPVIHAWGRELGIVENASTIQRACSGPLEGLVFSYTPADDEFPKAFLFPVLLGVGSGSVLVVALAWILVNEGRREVRTAMQRVSFVNQVSHELRTPLTNIRLYTEMAASRAEANGDPTAQRYLTVVEAEIARLSRLIQNVLSMAKQQRDRLTIRPSTQVLDEALGKIVEHWRPLLEQKGFTVETRLEAPLELPLDSDALEQIVGNLLSNVEKYAAPGKWVRIASSLNGRSANVTIDDRGPGIPPSKRSRVFEPFERLRADLNEGVSGTGIGLTISRELAVLHGGDLTVDQSPMGGASFKLSLPTQAAP